MCLHNEQQKFLHTESYKGKTVLLLCKSGSQNGSGSAGEAGKTDHDAAREPECPPQPWKGQNQKIVR